MQNRMRASLAVGLCALVVGAVLAGCGGSSGGSGGNAANTKSASGVSGQDLARYQKELQEAFKGTYTPPQGAAFKPPSGRRIWTIEVGAESEASQLASQKITEAAGKLGWSVHVFDGKYEPNRQLTGIEQAVAAGAQGIVLLYFDCPPVKAALEQAKRAGVKVVGVESKDCSPSLETNVLFANHEGFVEHNENGFGAFQAKYVIGETNGEAKVITTEETDLETTRAIARGVRKVMAKCSTCKIVDEIKFVGAELGPQLQQKIEQALNTHPEANAFIANYDNVLTTGGGAAALRASGRMNDIKIVAGEGTAPGIELIHNNSGNDACVGVANDWLGYASVDALARMFAGQNMSNVDSGVGVQVCDKEHNLAPKGKPFQAPLAFATEYERLWQLK